MINLSIWLYGKPSWDMDIEGEEDIDPERFIEQGDYLKEHLHNIAKIVKKLRSAGWGCYGTLYSLEFCKNSIKTKKEAKEELKKLGVDEEISMIEFEDEEDYIEE